MIIEKTFPIAEQLFHNGLKITQELYRLLNKEAEVLKQSDHANALPPIAQQKQRLVTQLNQFSEQISQILTSEKLPNSNQGINQYFARASQMDLDTLQLTECWSEFLAITKKCRSMNEQNGASITLLTRHVQRSLQIVKGNAQTVNTYGPDGSTNPGLSSHSLISV
jgi:flagellar biosynthesis protein FlgN